ncbi:MAG: sporulation inhibitor of replication protein SirA [Bacilli bacterium]
MRVYHFYLIQPQIANEFRGKELLIYRLLNHANSQAIAKAQVRYITENIHEVLTQTLAQLQESPNIVIDWSVDEDRRELQIALLGEITQDTALFHKLFRINPYLFAVDYSSKRYGWLAPIKQSRLSKSS